LHVQRPLALSERKEACRITSSTCCQPAQEGCPCRRQLEPPSSSRHGPGLLAASRRDPNHKVCHHPIASKGCAWRRAAQLPLTAGLPPTAGVAQQPRGSIVEMLPCPSFQERYWPVRNNRMIKGRHDSMHRPFMGWPVLGRHTPNVVDGVCCYTSAFVTNTLTYASQNADHRHECFRQLMHPLH
jgi:hypothetical protein